MSDGAGPAGRADLRAALREAARQLAAAGVGSPEHDARALAAHVLGVARLEPALAPEPPADFYPAFGALVERRRARVPLQHLVGSAPFRYLELAVRPGVFVPRPETELLAGWAIEHLTHASRHPAHAPAGTPRPVVVDLCTGSGVIAKAIAEEVPGVDVHAVELDEDAFGWAQRNLAGTGVDLRHGDFATAFDDLLGSVDVVVCNPPYVPLEAWESVAVEARDHDPHRALFSGEDGLDAIRVLADRAAALLRPGGVVGVEHADVQGESAPAVFAALDAWDEVRDHRDLNDRPRFLTARRAVRAGTAGE